MLLKHYINFKLKTGEALRNFIKREEGASAIEYAIIASLIAVAIIALAGGVGEQINEVFQDIIDALS